ncbi:MAG: DUF3800 domain-containing protein [Chloroflexi bacterium]|nr:DUF3800 domain-containing protein [Chloroflexota bacterium]
MLVFIDESGVPHPNDSCIKSTVTAVCLPESVHRRIDTQLFSMKKKFLGNPEIELKSKNFLKPHVYEHLANHRELIESTFEMIGETELSIYATIVDRPTHTLEYPPEFLPVQYVRLLERVHAHLTEYCPPTEMAIIIYDGEGRGAIKGSLGIAINAYLIRTKDGIAMPRIVTTPFFVNSAITPGIQLADLAAGCIRLSEEKDTSPKLKKSSALASAVARYRKVIQSKTNNFDREWGTLYGMSYVSEGALCAGEKRPERD